MSKPSITNCPNTFFIIVHSFNCIFSSLSCFACVQIRHTPLSGGYCGEVPPLPIPNREVKLTCADGTAMQCGRVGSRLLLSRASDFERFLRLFWSFYLLMMFLSADDVDYTDFYYLCSMIWTDRIRQVKIFWVIAAVFIAVASLVVSHFLVRDLAEEERTRMAVWAEAMRTLNNADENTDLNLVLKVINENNSIPVIVMDSENHAQTFRNVDVEGKDYADSLAYASAIGQRLLKQGKNIKIELDDSTHDYIQVCYDESRHDTTSVSLSLYSVGGSHALCGYCHLCFAYFQKERNRTRCGWGCLKKLLISWVLQFPV